MNGEHALVHSRSAASRERDGDREKGYKTKKRKISEVRREGGKEGERERGREGERGIKRAR